jgi:hypothetical protein
MNLLSGRSHGIVDKATFAAASHLLNIHFAIEVAIDGAIPGILKRINGSIDG